MLLWLRVCSRGDGEVRKSVNLTGAACVVCRLCVRDCVDVYSWIPLGIIVGEHIYNQLVHGACAHRRALIFVTAAEV